MALAKPAAGNITQGYSSSHRAIDYGWGKGKKVLAAEAGTISFDVSAGYGLRASIDHGVVNGKRIVSRYAHLASSAIAPGPIAKGQWLGVMGSSGSFTKQVHLHFEVLADFTKVDPTGFFASDNGQDDDMDAEQSRKLTAVYDGMWNGGQVQVDGVLKTYKYGVLPILAYTQELVLAQGKVIEQLALGQKVDPAPFIKAINDAFAKLDVPTAAEIATATNDLTAKRLTS